MAEGAPRYVREPPQLHPAIVGCLERSGRVTSAEVMGSLLALVADGALETRPSVRQVTTLAGASQMTVTELRVVPERWAALDPLDQALIAFLADALGGPSALTLADIQAAAHHRPRRFAQGLRAWEERVVGAARAAGLLEGRRITETGRAAVATHAAFKRYPQDFGTLEDEPPVAVELWGRYLAFATVFGIAERVATELDITGPGAAANPNLATWKAWLGTD